MVGPTPESHVKNPTVVQQGRIKAALYFVWVSLQTMATEAHRLRGQYWHLFKVKKQGTEDGEFLHCTDCWSTFLPMTKGTEYSFRTQLSGSAALWHSQAAKGFLRGNCSYLSLLKNWSSRKPSLSFIVDSQQDTSSFCTFWSVLLRLGVLVLTVLWKVETLEKSRTAPKTAMALLDPPSIPYPILTKKLEEIRLVLSLTKYYGFTNQVKIETPSLNSWKPLSKALWLMWNAVTEVLLSLLTIPCQTASSGFVFCFTKSCKGSFTNPSTGRFSCELPMGYKK